MGKYDTNFLLPPLPAQGPLDDSSTGTEDEGWETIAVLEDGFPVPCRFPVPGHAPDVDASSSHKLAPLTLAKLTRIKRAATKLRTKKSRKVIIKGKEFTGPFKIIVPDDNGHPLVDVAKIPASSTYSDGRLYTVNQASFRKRKQASIHNDHERSRYQLVSRSLERQRTITNHQLQKGSSSYRKSLTNLRTLGICLKSAHPAPVSTQPATELSPYGRYNGRSVKDFKYDVQKHIEQNSPQNRKLKKKDQLIQSGLGDGRIVPEKDIMDKFNSMIEKPFKPFKLSENNYFKRKDNSVLPQLGGGPKMVNLHGKGFSNFFATGSCVSFL